VGEHREALHGETMLASSLHAVAGRVSGYHLAQGGRRGFFGAGGSTARTSVGNEAKVFLTVTALGTRNLLDEAYWLPVVSVRIQREMMRTVSKAA
jgi:hypothetical protein